MLSDGDGCLNQPALTKKKKRKEIQNSRWAKEKAFQQTPQRTKSWVMLLKRTTKTSHWTSAPARGY